MGVDGPFQRGSQLVGLSLSQRRRTAVSEASRHMSRRSILSSGTTPAAAAAAAIGGERWSRARTHRCAATHACRPCERARAPDAYAEGSTTPLALGTFRAFVRGALARAALDANGAADRRIVDRASARHKPSTLVRSEVPAICDMNRSARSAFANSFHQSCATRDSRGVSAARVQPGARWWHVDTRHGESQ